jgi:hypothetical protein
LLYSGHDERPIDSRVGITRRSHHIIRAVPFMSGQSEPTTGLQLFQRKLLLASTLSLTLFAACGPSDLGADRLKSVDGGAPRTELLQAMGQGPLVGAGADTMRLVNGYRRQMYVVSGQQYEVVWYRAEPGSLADPITKERETPILVHADTVMGWGWKYFQKKARELDLPDPLRSSERLDSISRSQQPGA